MLPLCIITPLSHAEAVTVQGDSLVMQNTAKAFSAMSSQLHLDAKSW